MSLSVCVSVKMDDTVRWLLEMLLFANKYSIQGNGKNQFAKTSDSIFVFENSIDFK